MRPEYQGRTPERPFLPMDQVQYIVNDGVNGRSTPMVFVCYAPKRVIVARDPSDRTTHRSVMMNRITAVPPPDSL